MNVSRGSYSGSVLAVISDLAGTMVDKEVATLARIACEGDFEIARAAGRAMQNIVYHAGRPGASDEANAVAAELVRLVGP